MRARVILSRVWERRREGSRRRLRRRHVVAAVVALAVGIGAAGGVMHSFAEAAPDSLPGNCNQSFGELPDICPSLPTNTIDNGGEPYLEILHDGTKRYRFDAVLWNAGGAFELEGINCSSGICPQVQQRIWEGDGVPDGPSRAESIPGRLIFDVGDGHNHYHYENAARYEIVVPGGTNLVAAKVGFCMFDTYPDPHPTPNIPPRHYTGNCPLDGNTVEMGIARGWGDYYNAPLTYQWIVVNGLRAGTHTLRATVNPGREFIEANYANNVLDTTREIPGATANDVNTTTEPDTPLTVELSGSVEGRGVLVKRSGQNIRGAGDSIQFQIINGPTNGTITAIQRTGNTTAEVAYTPSPGYLGPDTFTYQTTDSRGLTSLVRTVSINVAEPPPPPPPPPVEQPPPPAAQKDQKDKKTTELDSRPTKPRRLTMNGTRASETIRATGAAEIINGKAGNDTIYARGGRDLVRGGKGNDRIFGGAGIDILLAGRGNDVIRARDGKRDVVDCGRGKKDRAIVDVLDRVAANCEKVVLPA